MCSTRSLGLSLLSLLLLLSCLSSRAAYQALSAALEVSVVDAVPASTPSAMATATRDQFPQVIAHRGASGYVPEHSLQAYQTALDLLADYIEPDLCVSKDGVFVALHDVLLDDTTDVASVPQFADRKTTRTVDGAVVTGFFVNDFTFAELEQLTLLQRLPFRTPLYNGAFRMPSLQQILGLAEASYNATGRLAGLYLELKHPAYFRSMGFAVEDMLLQQLQAGGLLVQGPAVARDLKQVVPVVVQCFDAAALQQLRPHTSLPLVLLVDPPTPQQLKEQSYWTEPFLASAAAFADGIGPEKTFFSSLPLDAGRAAVSAAYAHGLAFHPWTFRAEAQYVGAKFSGDFSLEQAYFYCCLGVDALFSEFPDRSREAVDGLLHWQAEGRPGCPVDCAGL